MHLDDRRSISESGLSLPFTALMFALILTACSAGQSASKQEADINAKLASIPITQRKLGQLQLFITDQTTDGRNIKLRGLIRNPYLEAIDGIRVLFAMYPDGTPDAKELDRAQTELDVHLEAGGQTALRWDLQSMYAGMAGRSVFRIGAFAMKRGGELISPPPAWRG